MNITLLAIERCMPSSIFAPIDVLTMANMYWRDLTGEQETTYFQTEVVTADGQPVAGFNQMTIQPDRPMQDARQPDLILLPSLIPLISARRPSTPSTPPSRRPMCTRRLSTFCRRTVRIFCSVYQIPWKTGKGKLKT